MKISIVMSNNEKSYIQRAIRRFAPDMDQTSIWTDMDSKAPAYRSTQITDQSGNFEASLDLNSDFVMDLVDVCCEVVEKVRSFSFMMKGAVEGMINYGKGLSKRFEKWQTEDQKAVNVAMAMYTSAVKENRKLRSEDMYIAVAFDSEGRSHSVFGESAEQMSSRSGNMMKDLNTDKVYYFLIMQFTNFPIAQTKEEINKQIASEQETKGKRETTESKEGPKPGDKAFDGPVYDEHGAETSGYWL